MQNMAEAGMKAIARAVRRRRKALKFSQTDLARLAGTSRLFVSKVEAGKPSPRLDLLVAVLSALGLGLRLVEARSPLEVADDVSGE
ncbi:MAG: hypothetical protein AKCLJLPJ_01196 [Fimbriimonadales bacterium]|nr:MAG: helix-turn-helix domain-containing protein [Armatimonadota bacterium]MBV6503132.1 hypothetical protein [Fimbriimonadales bacterium]MCE7900817.1 helix-turn-helix domain-containing protein [Armatimonadetes bacterium ATM1]MDL1929853.1 helix-turn-helix domain-containing protein [Fimbriimonadia bacterium ATM]MBC6970506.1 helix-turn-helix domain-containing protein [Armatimonadota bacterium]